MIESMAGKSAAMHGLVHDATPFSFSEDEPAIDYFGRLLTKGKYMCCPAGNLFKSPLKGCLSGFGSSFLVTTVT